MTLRTGFLATLILLLGSASASAQVPVPIRLMQYSAKFLCGDAKEGGVGVRPGVYETSINIHNPEFPGTQQPVAFVKKAVRSPREGEDQFKFGRFVLDRLPADLSEQVDCKIIRSILDPSAASAAFIEGFVVLIVIPNPLPTPHELDVVGVYTVDTPQGGISLEMVPVAARTLSLPGPAGRRMLNQLLEQAKPQ